MVNKIHQQSQTPIISSLASEFRSYLPTSEAAAHLNRQEQTLRMWACLETGPIRPIRIHGRLAWPVDQLKSLLVVEKTGGER
jgi:hypothetical protein